MLDPLALKIQIVSRLYHPEPAAASFRLRAVAKEARRARHRVKVVTTRSPVAGSDDPGIRVSRWPVLRDSAGYVRGYLQYMSFDIPAFFRVLLAPRPDVVLCEPPPTTGAVVRVACAVKRVPYVYFAADVWSEAVRDTGTAPWVVGALRAVEKWALRGAREIVATSQPVAETIRSMGVTAPLSVVGNGVDTETFNGDVSMKAATDGDLPADDNAKGAPLFVYTGTASEVHGASIFVEAMKHVIEVHPRARLVFIGQGTEIEAMREQARAIPAGVVSFLPRQSPEVIARWLAQADQALASVRPGAYEFAFPTKIYAAAASGVPVVFAGGSPTAEIVIGQGLGSAVAWDPELVANAMLTQLTGPFDAKRSRKWVVEHGSLSATARRVLDVLQRVARPATS